MLRERFDALLEGVLDDLPPQLRALLDEVPLVVEDLPSPGVLRDLGMHPDEAIELCGLHSGRAFIEGRIDTSGELPAEIQIYREGIVDQAGGWRATDSETDDQADARITREIRITVLHEIGHQFGLDEDDLDRLGYA